MSFGTGKYRLGWPAQALIDQGYTDVKVTYPSERWQIGAKTRGSTGEVVDVVVPDDATVIVLQRVTHRHLLECIPFWQKLGIRCCVDVDDLLSSVSPNNPAFQGLKPRPDSLQSWRHLAEACRIADVVTVTTPGLAVAYRRDAVVLENCLPPSFDDLSHVDSTEICWPASLPSHPEDASVLGPTLDRVVRDTGAKVRLIGEGPHAGPLLTKTFGLSTPPILQEFVSIDDWPVFLSGLGIGIAPLSDTKFNTRGKSALKPLELMGAGVPWVGSPSDDYSRLHRETGVGLLARRPGDWYKALRKMVTDDAFRAEQSAAGIEAAKRYRIADRAHLWHEVWRG